MSYCCTDGFQNRKTFHIGQKRTPSAIRSVTTILATRGYPVGCHQTYIGMLEWGEKSPSLRTIFNLAFTLKVDSSEIVKQVERIVGKR